MDKRQFMSNGPKGRNRIDKTKQATPRVKANTGPRRRNRDTAPLLGPLEEAVENERARLSRAQTLLGCVHAAMEYAEADTDDTPYYPDLVDMARKLVREAINRLDSVYLQPLIQPIGEKRKALKPLE